MPNNFLRDWSNQQALQQKLAVPIEWYQSIDSTNIRAQHLIAKQPRSPYLIVSNQQTAGYGKQQRPFISDRGGIFLTWIQTIPTLNSTNHGLLTIAAVSALHQTIAQYWQRTTVIKWVNDLLWQHHKIAGILIEQSRTPWVSIGIGLNLYQAHITNQVPQAGNLLTAPPANQDIVNFLFQLVQNLSICLEHFTTGECLTYYRQYLSTLGQWVQVQMGTRHLQGQVQDINDAGNLILQTANQQYVIAAGDIIEPPSY